MTAKDLVLVTPNGEEKNQFVSSIVKVFEDKRKAVVFAYYQRGLNLNFISKEVKEVLEIEDENEVLMALVSFDEIEVVLSGGKIKEINGHDEDLWMFDLPGFYIQFKKSEHLEMFEEYSYKHLDERFEASYYNPTKMQVYFPSRWQENKLTILEKRMAVTKFKNDLNLSYVPTIVEGTVPFEYIEECTIEPEVLQYIRKEKKED